MIRLRRVAACTVVSLWLVGCTNDNSTSAPISSVGGDRSGTMLSKANTDSSGGRIVYNRSYDNIPKGSYSGNTYTVKRGDTLFYIAWITGNDFRDLAAKNNIAEPYSLNVGQSIQLGNGSGGGMLAAP
ncbi:LysM peptidoglycan-binding domain-containing protein, partial [Yersinia pestis]|uniref:LysM peptidoglycan-binding domain-containing protein n=1 Tax=Yersinia pestis TaxID=632 RepID=UPI0005788925